MLGSLETYDFEKPFTFVLVSSAESWGATKIPEPAEGEEPREVRRLFRSVRKSLRHSISCHEVY